jgi:hypothetical protein
VSFFHFGLSPAGGCLAFFCARYSPMRIPCESPMMMPCMYWVIMLWFCYMLVVCLFEVVSVCACGEVESDYSYYLL